MLKAAIDLEIMPVGLHTFENIADIPSPEKIAKRVDFQKWALKARLFESMGSNYSLSVLFVLFLDLIFVQLRHLRPLTDE